MKTLRRYGARLGAVLAATLLAVALGECAVRLVLPAYDPSGQVSLVRQGDLMLGRPGTRARQRKNTGDYDVEVRFGPRGFRDRHDVAEALPRDLLVVGDSFAFGWGVAEERRFSDVLAALTGQRVFNIAMPGQSLDDYDLLIRHARALGSRSVRLVVTLCMENDLVDARAPVAGRAAANGALSAAAGVAAAKYWLADRSALYGLMATAIHRVPRLEALAAETGLVRRNLGAVVDRPFDAASVEATADRLAALAQGYETIVLIVPSRGLWLERTKEDADRVHRAAVAAIAARGLTVVDPRAAFEATGAPLSLHFARDGHWNEGGHRLAAECLARR